MAIEISPTFPKVRCVKCGATYTVDQRNHPITGICPSCGYDRFNTSIESKNIRMIAGNLNAADVSGEDSQADAERKG